jgi:Vesicle coat protein involved in Golgi to plasma membrane transport
VIASHRRHHGLHRKSYPHTRPVLGFGSSQSAFGRGCLDAALPLPSAEPRCPKACADHSLQISLAHFCEVHGPTSILCTQLSPVSCSTCYPISTPPSEDTSKNSSFSSGFWEPTSPGLNSSTAPLLYSPFESPPTSPRSPTGSFNPYFSGAASDRDGFGRLSIGSEQDYDACDNCTFLVPKGVSERLPDGAPGSPTKDGKGRHGCPVLRTTQAVLAQGSPAHSDDDEDEDEGHSAKGTPFTKNGSSPDPLDPSPTSTTQSGGSSPLYIPRHAHTHLLQYVTTRQPASPAAYSLLRRSCIRTLSCENLPRGSPSGPLLFGDPIAGYTIAYVFRLPDPRARGRRRTYALIALGGRDSWRVSTAMVQITKVFESIAGQIVAMADSVLERESGITSQVNSRPSSTGMATPPLSASAPTAAEKDLMPPEKQRSKSTATSPVSRNISDVSSFLSAKKVDPDGYPRVSREVMRAKGLAEIVGKDDFFVQLHLRFVMVLMNLVKEFSR